MLKNPLMRKTPGSVATHANAAAIGDWGSGEPEAISGTPSKEKFSTGKLTVKQTDLMLKFTMPPGMGGPHDFRVQLKTNDPSQPEKELAVLSNWID